MIEPKPTTDLYFESHVTIEPVFDERLEEFEAICANHGFRAADLLLQKRKVDTPVRSAKDSFCTARSKEWDDIYERTHEIIDELEQEGFQVWRYKIENTLIDVRMAN